MGPFRLTLTYRHVRLVFCIAIDTSRLLQDCLDRTKIYQPLCYVFALLPFISYISLHHSRIIAKCLSPSINTGGISADAFSFEKGEIEMQSNLFSFFSVDTLRFHDGRNSEERLILSTSLKTALRWRPMLHVHERPIKKNLSIRHSSPGVRVTVVIVIN